jgi:hypothetical protein
VTESWITAFLDAVIAADQIEGRANELSESSARGLLQWCMNPDRPGVGGGGSASFSPKCVMCGQPAHVPALAGAESHGDPLDHTWLCHIHRSVMQSILGRPSSPGRPGDPPHDQRVKRLRGLSHRLSAARSQQPASPVMPRPAPGRPGASSPKMPAVSP